MPKNFAYKAKDRSGQVLTGSIVAENEAAVAAYIRSQGQFVTRIQEDRKSLTFERISKSFQKVTIKELAVFCRQFATMVDAGLSLVICLNILTDQTETPN